mgnify:CR=1 FL=1
MLRGILEPCALGLILKMMRRKLERGKTYTLSRFFVSTHETRVFWRKLFIASCEAPFSFTPLCNLAWRWAGAQVGQKGVVLSELHGAVDAHHEEGPRGQRISEPTEKTAQHSARYR